MWWPPIVLTNDVDSRLPTASRSKLNHGQRPRRSAALTLAKASSFNIAVLAGDGIGPEISAVGTAVLREAGRAESTEFHFQDALIGGAATDATGSPLPSETLEICKRSDAVLLAAIGG